MLALGACSKQAENNAVAPGRPGTGNGVEVVKPAAPDSPPSGSSGSSGAVPHTGSSGGDATPGVTGSGTASKAPAPTGSGLDGGLNTHAAGNAGSPEPAAATQGSANTTTGSSFGNRP